MSKRLVIQRTQQKHPHDLLEDLALSNEWRYERLTEAQMSLEIEGFSCDVNFFSHWDEHAGCLDIMGAFEISIPEGRKKDVFEVLSALSFDTRLGYFTLCPSQECPLFRHTFLAYPKSPITLRHITDTMEEALSGGEKLCQAMHFLLDQHKTSQEAVFASLIEVIGEA